MSPAETTKAMESRSRFRSSGAACPLRCASNSFMYPMAYTETRNPMKKIRARKNAESPSRNSSEAAHGTGAGSGMRIGASLIAPTSVTTRPRKEATAPPPKPTTRERRGSRIRSARMPGTRKAEARTYDNAEGIVDGSISSDR